MAAKDSESPTMPKLVPFGSAAFGQKKTPLTFQRPTQSQATDTLFTINGQFACK